MGKINSKAKGKNGELEICRKLREYGYDVRRSVQYNGKSDDGDPDIVGLEYIRCEIKRVEKLNIDNAIDQCIRDKITSNSDDLPAVFHRKNNRPWLVTMPLESWIQLYDSYYSDQKLKEIDDGKMDDLIDNKIVPEMNENKK